LRRGQGKQKLDGLKSIDLRYLHRNNLLVPGKVSTLWWIRKGKEIGSFTITAADDHIIVSFLVQSSKQDVTQTIELTRMGCHLGGTRPFMKCPHCDRQVLLLYLGPYDFRCRHSWQLTYASRNESKLDLQFRRVRNARSKLEAPANLTVPIAARAKWKHRSKYYRLLSEADLQHRKVLGMMKDQLTGTKT
jgi:hypothetical protein